MERSGQHTQVPLRRLNLVVGLTELQGGGKKKKKNVSWAPKSTQLKWVPEKKNYPEIVRAGGVVLTASPTQRAVWSIQT